MYTRIYAVTIFGQGLEKWFKKNKKTRIFLFKLDFFNLNQIF